jgi:hypothetical protein
MVFSAVLLLVPQWVGGAPPEEDAAPTGEAHYAEVKLALAEANLRKVELINERVRNAVSAHVLAEFRSEIQVAKFKLERARQGDENPFPAWLLRVKTNYETARAFWQDAVAANQRVPGTIDPVDVERMRLRTELYRIHYARGRAVADASTEAQLAWHLNVMNDEIERLKDAVFRTPVQRSSYF